LSPAGAAFRIELSVDQVREAQQKNPEARCYARPDRFVAALLAMTMSILVLLPCNWLWFCRINGGRSRHRNFFLIVEAAC
jgi:hypothetical protein